MLVWLFFFKQKTAYEMRISDWSSDVCSSDLLETATADQRKARAALEKAAAGLSLEQNQTAVLKANRAEAQAQIVQAEADIAAVQLDLDNTVLRAPIDGVVGNRTGQIGKYVRAGTARKSKSLNSSP